jgi:glycosyltransferase involved in cell wall biosynthesis
MYGGKRSKYIRVFVGTMTDIFYPRKEVYDNKVNNIYFHGSFIPLQGIKYIIDSAYALRDRKDIMFTILGRGQEYSKLHEYYLSLKISNIDFLPNVAYEELPEKIAQGCICLGIFGSSHKALRVIPNKIFEYASMGKAVITSKSDAVLELFEEGKNIVFCEPHNADDLRNKILQLIDDPREIDRIGRNARKIIEEKCLPETLVRGLLIQLTTHK